MSELDWLVFLALIVCLWVLFCIMLALWLTHMTMYRREAGK
ncbi:MAG: hypothetical protein ACTSYX_04895 [Candidatus Thorarchaeota archaeon]